MSLTHLEELVKELAQSSPKMQKQVPKALRSNPCSDKFIPSESSSACARARDKTEFLTLLPLH